MFRMRWLSGRGQYQQLFVATYAGAVVAVFTIIACLSFGSLIFAGDLSFGVSQGIATALISAVIVGIIVALRSSYPATIAMPQDRTAPILALMAAAVVSQIPPATPPAVKCVTVPAAIALTSILTGVILYTVGRFQLGNLIRFIPYPVVGGFLSGSGWLLALGSIRVMTGQPLTEPSQLFEQDLFFKWLPGVLFGVFLFLMLRRYRRPILVPTLLVAGVALFYVFVAIAGVPVGEMRAGGWLPTIPAGEGFRSLLWDVALLKEVEWLSLASAARLAGTVLLTSIISILLNASALELVVHHEIDLNRELRAAGVANVAAGLSGGMLGFQSLSLSRLAHEMGSRTRWTGLVAAAFCLGVIFLGPAPMFYLPRFVLGGLLLFLGIGFLVEWLYDAWFKLPMADYAVVLLILGVIGTVGYLEGVGFGILAAVFLFIHNYSRVGVIMHALTGVERQSNVDRPLLDQRLLREKGKQIYVLKLQGFIFFGTANSLLNDIRTRVENPQLPPLRFAVLDFRRVSGIDSSAVLSLAKTRQLATKHKFMLVLTDLPAQILQQLRRGGFERDVDTTYHFFADLDHSIEWCEERILKLERSPGTIPNANLRETLGQNWPNGHSNSVDRFFTYLEQQKVSADAHLIRQGDSADALYFVESGEVTTMLELADGGTQRLRRQGSGTVVGELGLFLGVPRTASIVTNEPCLVYRLSASSLDRMKRDEPEVAADFYQFVTRVLAERVVNCTKSIRALSE